MRHQLIETYPLTPLGFNWEIRRWDGWRSWRDFSASTGSWHDLVRLWETADGDLAGAVHPEGEGELFLQIHPDYRDLEDEMIAWGEDNLDVYREQQRQLDLFIYDHDDFRRDLAARRGYEALPYGGVARRTRLDREIPRGGLAPGYFLRSVRADERDYERAAALLNAAFNRTLHTAAEYAHMSTHSLSYRHLLDLVAEASDGSFAALVGVSLDLENRLAVVEPVCTHPAHRRNGLARTLINAGLNRVKALGAVEAVLGTGDDPGANALYEATGFTEVNHGLVWRKVW